MKILGIDTSTREESAAVTDGSRILYEITNSDNSYSSRRILFFVDLVLKKSFVDLKEIEAIAVTIGPGSFTGLRIGLSICKGLSLATGKPVIPISTLDGVVKSYSVTKRVVPLLDARREEVYTAIYDETNGQFERIEEEMAIGIDKLCDKIKEETIFLGDGAIRYGNTIKDRLGRLAIIHTGKPKLSVAAAAAFLSIPVFRKGEFVDSNLIKPRYIRRSEAEINLENKKGIR